MFWELNRVEFVITKQCTGRCKHCSVGDLNKSKGYVQYDRIKGILTKLCSRFPITSVMCFGGEPLLHYKEVEGIMSEAKSCAIPKRQLITNGYFSKKNSVMEEAAAGLAGAGVNDILLSADAFHQETLPIETVYEFARLIREKEKLSIRLHPAWLVDQEDQNEWNNRTNQILLKFSELQLPISKGNVIFPSGNAVHYLADYFEKSEWQQDFYCGQAPYSTRLDQVNSISIEPNGDVIVCCFPIGNVYEEDINDILDRYQPYDIPPMKALLDRGLQGLIQYAGEQGISVDLSNAYSPCGLCHSIVDKLPQYQSQRG